MSTLEIALEGEATRLSPEARRSWLGRDGGVPGEVHERVAAILDDVRARGDESLRALAEEHDGVRLDALEVTAAARREALDSLAPELRAALERAAAAIERVHREQLPRQTRVRPMGGVEVGRRPVPLGRVGVYAPGGRAAYPSSVLMGVVPARVAGVDEIVVCSPPGPDGLPAAAVLAACEIAGADRVFALGGAGAVAALAYGTESVPRVDKIVGPGGIWVDEAKRQVAREVAIDCPAGPSEILVIAAAEADPDRLAAELLAQAEHDGAARVALLSPAQELLDAVRAALARQLEDLPTAATARTALARGGALLLVPDLEEALALAEAYAPEHLLLVGKDAERLGSRVRRAGCVFTGQGASVAHGDYATGGNHVLPTGGRAAAWSGLGVLDFVRFVSWQRIDAEGAVALRDTVTTLAEAEGLAGHARAASLAAATGGRAANGPAKRRPPDDAAVPAGIRATRRYDPGRRECEIELSDNTNRFGSAPAAIEELRRADPARAGRYPTVYGDRLKEAIAGWLGVDPAHVATGCGSDDLLDSTFHAFAGGGGSIAYSDPTFSMVRAFGTVNDARLRPVPTDRDLVPDLDGLAAADADLVYLCRPDNPSGYLVPGDAVERLLQRVSGTLVVDEAYLAFADTPSLAPLAARTPGLVVLGTFSKAWGLAGLRIGYAVADTDRIDLVERARGPYKLNALAESAAARALAEDGEWLATTVAAAREAREQLERALDARGLDRLPSAANFVFVRLPHAARVAASMRAHGVGVRPFSELPGGDGLRMTVGPAPEMDRLLDALDRALAETAKRPAEEAS